MDIHLNIYNKSGRFKKKYKLQLMCEKFLIQLSLAFMETIKTTFLTGKDKILCYMPFMGQMEEACSH